jgi:glucose/arabinose dehydrogenase
MVGVLTKPRGARAPARMSSVARCLLASALLLAAEVAAQPSLDDPSLKVETVASGLASPTQMAFLGPNDILVLQKNDGRVRRILNGTLQPTPVLDVAVDAENERGLLGIAINTASPPQVLLYYTEVADPDGDGLPDGGTPLGNRVYRYTWNAAQAKLESPQLVLDLPVLSGPNHNGGVLLLGPGSAPQQTGAAGDGSLLYAAIGDLNRNGQLENFPAGPAPDDTAVILRVAQDGTPAPGNPFVPYCSQTPTQACPSGTGCPMGETCVSQVAAYYAYGVRNSFGLALDPVTGALWDTENGPGSYDEVNLVAPGSNSGWEQIMGPDDRDSQSPADLFDMPGAGSTYSDPEFSWLAPIAVTALLFPSGSALGPAYDDVALVGDFNNAQLYRLPLDAQRDGFDLSGFTGLDDLVADSSTERNALRIGTGFGGAFGGITDLEQGPDGAVYVVSIGAGAVYRITSANSVSGTVRYYVGMRPVPDVAMRLADGGIATTSTDAAGRFAFDGLSAQDHIVEPQKSGGGNDAISSLDASLVQQAVVGLLDFGPLQTLACDVTADGSLSSLDAARIQQLRVGTITTLPVATSCGSDWVFVPTPAAAPNQTLIDPFPATPSCRAGAIAYEPLAGELVDQDFIAALFGDCSGSWEPRGN